MNSVVRVGIDIGSTTTKLVALDDENRIVQSLVEPSAPKIREQAGRMLDALREQTRLGARLPIVATGYGRKLVEGASRQLTEISCHARGAFHLMRQAGVLIDIGGQDTKAIRIESNGEVADFAMNDKCAAGTGRFLEVILGRLGVGWEQLEELVHRKDPLAIISSTCTVFAESEVISMLANGQSVASITKGLHASFADRIAAMAGRFLAGAPQVFLSGGVAHNQAMLEALSLRLGRDLQVVPSPQLVGALGAALSAPGGAQSG